MVMVVGDKVFLHHLASVFIPAVVAGFFAMSAGQAVVDSLYHPLAQFGFDSWLRGLGNLQLAYEYLLERDNLARWNRIAVYYAFFIPLLPLSWLVGVRLVLHFSKRATVSLNKDKLKLQGVKLIFVCCFFFSFFLYGMVRKFVPDFFTVTLNVEHLPSFTHSSRSFFGWQSEQNSIYASDMGFFHASVGLILQTMLVILLLGISKLFFLQVLPAQFGAVLPPISGYFRKFSALLIMVPTGFFIFSLLLGVVGIERYSPCLYPNPNQHHFEPAYAALIGVIALLIDLFSSKVLTPKSVFLAALCPAMWFIVYVMLFLKTPGCTL